MDYLLCAISFAVVCVVRIIANEETAHFVVSKPMSHGSLLKSFEQISEIQCIHKCHFIDGCGSVAFEATQASVGRCHLLRNNGGISDLALDSMKIMKRKRVEPFVSCAALFADGARKSGNYFLSNIGWQFCNMKRLGICGAGGWTLAMAIDGTKGTFNFASSLWTNEKSFNEKKGLLDPLHKQAKYKSSYKLPFRVLCLGMKVGNDTRYLKIKKPSSKLVALFHDSGESRHETNILNAEWKKLLPDAKLQPSCNMQGFNVRSSTVDLRLGITSNDEGCGSTWTDTWIGVGGNALWCNSEVEWFTAGNDCCAEACMNERKEAMAYIYLQ